MTANVTIINIKNGTYYLFNDMISIKDFDSHLLKETKGRTKIPVFITLDT